MDNENTFCNVTRLTFTPALQGRMIIRIYKLCRKYMLITHINYTCLETFTDGCGLIRAIDILYQLHIGVKKILIHFNLTLNVRGPN